MQAVVFIRSAALLMVVGVGCGAFGAHALKSSFTPETMAIWQTATLYLFVHALGLLACGLLLLRCPVRAISLAAGLMLAGTLIFSGSLYALCLSEIKWLGAITPIGGTAFIAAWIALFLGAGQISRTA